MYYVTVKLDILTNSNLCPEGGRVYIALRFQPKVKNKNRHRPERSGEFVILRPFRTKYRGEYGSRG